MKNPLKIAMLTMGISSLVAQMVLLRELLIVFSGNELSIGIILANWLILEAFGSFFLGKKAENTKNKIETFVGITIFFSLSLFAAIYLTRILKSILGISIGETVGLLPMLYSSFLILLPVSVAHGALFSFGCKIYSMFSARDASPIGKVYVYETVGIMLGGIVWTYLLIPYFHSFQMIAGLALLNFLILLVLLASYHEPRMLKKITTVICGLLLTFSGYLLFAGGADKLHHLSINAQWKNHNIVHYQNSIYGNICVVEREGQYIFFSNGIVDLITPIPDIAFVEEFVHLPLLAHPDPRRVLVLGGGAGGVINGILKHPTIELVEYTELDPLLLNLIRKFPTPLTEDELTDMRVRVKHIDGHLFIRTTENKYDLILVGELNPSDLQRNRFFTKEFFSLAKERLDEDGILVTGLPGSLSYLNDELRNLNGNIFNTLKSVFPYVRVFPGEDRNLFLSSNSKEVFLIDTAKIIDRLYERNIETEVLVPWHIEKKLHYGWQEWFSNFLEGSTQRINRDLMPLGLFYSISHWNALYAPYISWLFRWLEEIDLWMFFALFVFLIAIFFLLRSRHIELFGSGIPLCIATTGFAGMLFYLGLIFTFQSIYGHVFHWIGLLTTSFMTGAAAGAMIMTSFLPRIKNCMKFFIKTDVIIICSFLGLPFIFHMLHSYSDNFDILPFLKILFLLISFIGGLLTGAQFPLASKIHLKDDTNISKTAGLLYSSDLLGGWLGGVVGGVVFLPVLGLLGSFIVVVLLKLWSLIIITTYARAIFRLKAS